MDKKEKLALLKSLRLFERVPEKQLVSLSAFLVPEEFAEGGVVFEEGSKGDCLYLIAEGRVRVRKKVLLGDGSSAFKDLAVLQAGDCLGEMALFDANAKRSARAEAAEKAVLFKLERGQLSKWLESDSQLAVGFFTELVQTLSGRLRRSSNELTLLFDLSAWLLEPLADGRELLRKVLSHLVPHLEGSWTAAAFLYNEFNDEMELAATEGSFDAGASGVRVPAADAAPSWADAQTFVVPLPGPRRLRGYLVFRAAAALPPAEKGEIARTLVTTAHLIGTALQNIDFRMEESFRSRLTSRRG
jgi:CRP-like cAMP-binding protein